MDLSAKGFIRYINNGYRTLGPIAKLANARNVRHFCATWQRIAELQKVNSDYLDGNNLMTNQRPNATDVAPTVKVFPSDAAPSLVFICS